MLPLHLITTIRHLVNLHQNHLFWFYNYKNRFRWYLLQTMRHHNRFFILSNYPLDSNPIPFSLPKQCWHREAHVSNTIRGICFEFVSIKSPHWFYYSLIDNIFQVIFLLKSEWYYCRAAIVLLKTCSFSVILFAQKLPKAISLGL